MQLKQIVTDKISEIGFEEASTYFGKPVATLKTWVKTQRIPLEASQKVLDDQPEAGIQAVTAPSTQVTPQHIDAELDPVWQRLAELNARLSPIEAFLSEHFPIGLDRPEPAPAPSSIEPIPSRNVPPVVTEATLSDNKRMIQRPPNADMARPVVAPQAPAPVSNEGRQPWVPDPRNWSRPHGFNQNQRS